MSSNWNYIVAYFCVPINIILIMFGIIINESDFVIAGIACIGLVMLPIAKDYYEKKEEHEKDKD